MKTTHEPTVRDGADERPRRRPQDRSPERIFRTLFALAQPWLNHALVGELGFLHLRHPHEGIRLMARSLSRINDSELGEEAAAELQQTRSRFGRVLAVLAQRESGVAA